MITVLHRYRSRYLNRFCLPLLWLLFALGAFSSPAPTAEKAQLIYQVEIQGAIGPVAADWLIRSIDTAAEASAALFIIRLDTPGGLVKSMRMINQAILASPIPVVVYVHPKGAHAASAGTYMLYAAHIAAMAPATNLGAATPVQIGFPGQSDQTPYKQLKNTKDAEENTVEGASNGKQQGTSSAPASTLERKQVNDSVAYIRSLADLRGRNADWAEKSVREAVSLEANEALKRKVIDYIAYDTEDLLAQLEGKSLNWEEATHTLALSPYEVIVLEPDWRHQLLSIITDPSIAYILMMIGIYGLILEFYNPGMGGPGILGAICLLTALFALQLLPISYAGLSLILLGVGLMLAEAFSPTFGILGIGGAVAFVIGSVLLMDTELPGYQIAWPVIAGTTVASAGIVAMLLHMAWLSRKQVVVSGIRDMIGRTAEVLQDFSGMGRVRVHGEVWQAHSNQTMRKGETVMVTGIHGLTLEVQQHKVEQQEIQ